MVGLDDRAADLGAAEDRFLYLLVSPVRLTRRLWRGISWLRSCRGRTWRPHGSVATWRLPHGCVGTTLPRRAPSESHRHADRTVHAVARIHHRPGLHGAKGRTSGLRFDLVCGTSRRAGREREPVPVHRRRHSLDLFALHGPLHRARARFGGDDQVEARNRDHAGASAQSVAFRQGDRRAGSAQRRPFHSSASAPGG